MKTIEKTSLLDASPTAPPKAGDGFSTPFFPLAIGPTYVTEDAFGNIVSNGGLSLDQQPYTYTGRPFDTIDGTTYNRTRYYDPNTGRFTQEDPIGFAGGINKYPYTRNAPTNDTDPSGEQGVATVVEAIGTAIVGAIILSAIGLCVCPLEAPGKPSEIAAKGAMGEARSE